MGRAAGRAPRNSAGQIPGPSSLCGLAVCLSSKSSLAALPRLEGQEEESLPPLARIRAARSPARRRGDAELDTATVTVPPREPRLLHGAVSSPPRRVHRSAASHGGLRVLRGRSRVLRTSVVADGATPGHGLILLPDPGAGAGAMPGADPSTDLAGGRSGGQTPRRPLAWAPCPRPAGPLPGCWARVPSAATSRQAFDTRPLASRRVSSTPRAPRRPPRGLLPAGPVCLSSPTVFSRGCLTQVPFLVCRLCPWGCHGPEGEAGCGGQVVLWPSQHLAPVGQPPAGPVPLRAASGPGGDPRGGGGVSRLPAGGRGGSVSSRSQSASQAVS